MYSHLPGKADYHVATREEAIECFERDMRIILESDREWFIETYLKPIAGKTLGCWCAPKACHGDVLIKLCREVGLI